jgi:iron complex outermembrane receptor protein
VAFAAPDPIWSISMLPRSIAGPRPGALAALYAISLCAFGAAAQTAGAPLSDAETAAKRAQLQRQLEEIQAQLRQLDGERGGAPTPAAPPAPAARAPVPEVVVTGATLPSVTEPTGSAVTTIDRELFKDSPAFSAGQVLQYSPGVTIKQGNGPRDVGISIRGSNARNGFGVRNLQVLEDGFPVTQPDGLSRTDLTDPHAYSGIDVYRGPQSPLFGNYATGGAINFRTRTGAEIGGVELGTDVGSFGYVNGYLAWGNRVGSFDYSLFGSHVRGDGYIQHSSFNTTTENILASYAPTPDDKITFKFINNDLDAALPIRLSLTQYRLNPFQRGCGVASAANTAAGCATVNLLANGFNGATVAQTADQAGLGRSDRRTIVGARWEHSVDSDTVWRNQVVFDNKDINQPTGATSARGAQPAFNAISDVTKQASLFGRAATHYAGLAFNYVDLNALTYNVAPGGGSAGGNAVLGGLTNQTFGHQYNLAARAREEVKLDPQWRVVGGLGVEYTSLDARNTLFAYPVAGTPSTTLIPALREFINVAPEAALLYSPSEEWLLHGRVATGYGTPQAGNLFVTPAGVNGNNTALKSQTNVGFDLGADWTPASGLTMGVNGFYEFFTNELVTQSPGVGLQNFTFNAPASEHRGVEAYGDWRPRALPGWRLRLAYTYDDQYYTKYVERLSAGARTASFSRAHNKIPGVEPNFFTARLGYDHPEGLLAGLGGFVEVNFRDEFFIDNANLLKVPSYELVNLNLHYDPARAGTDTYFPGLSLFLEVQNLLNQTYVASANNVANSISAATGLQNGAATVAAAGGSIYAGSPRAYIGGMRLRF